MLQSSALAFSNGIVHTQGHTVQKSEEQLMLLLCGIKYHKIKSTGEIYEQIILNSKK